MMIRLQWLLQYQLYANSIYAEPEKYFNDKIMKQLEEAAKKEFLYGEYDEEEVTDANGG